MKGKNIHFGDPGALDILYRVTGGETGPVRLGQAHGGTGHAGRSPTRIR
ncbi:MAG TPA: hypothetical protein VFX43_07620 [Chitinophagaceae bacterium]|nr:hypothetical protein [Chitinophagaceae bacterium]